MTSSVSKSQELCLFKEMTTLYLFLVILGSFPWQLRVELWWVVYLWRVCPHDLHGVPQLSVKSVNKWFSRAKAKISLKKNFLLFAWKVEYQSLKGLCGKCFEWNWKAFCFLFQIYFNREKNPDFAQIDSHFSLGNITLSNRQKELANIACPT